MTRKGFTLIELLVVVAVLALLASIVFSNLGGAREGARISNALSFQSQTHSLLGSDLVGWWNFNDPSSRYKDISGSGNNGSCTSCPIPGDGVPGTVGVAMQFDGITNRINYPNSDSLDIVGSDLTISAWVKPKLFKSAMAFVHKDTQYSIAFYGDVNSGTITYADSSIWSYSSFGHHGSFLPNNWYHIVVTKNPNNFVTIYSNSQIVISKNFGGAISSKTSILNVGSYASNYWYDGLIDDVRIYSRALTLGEVNKIYAQTKDKYLAESNE